MRYFISGHRDITQEKFNEVYKPAILGILEKDRNASFVVGDCEGVDAMAQILLSQACEPRQVTVYHMLEHPRNLASEHFRILGGFKSDIERDSAMTENSDYDIAYIEPGRWTSGTAQNILRRYEKL